MKRLWILGTTLMSLALIVRRYRRVKAEIDKLRQLRRTPSRRARPSRIRAIRAER